MIEFYLSLLETFLQPDWLSWWFYPLFSLAFLATVPRIIRYFFER